MRSIATSPMPLRGRSASAPRARSTFAAVAEAEVHAQVVLRVVAAAAADLLDLRAAAGSDSERARRWRCGSTWCRPACSAIQWLAPARESSRNRSGVSCTLLTTTSTSPSLSKSPKAAPRPAFGVVTGGAEPLGHVLEPAVAAVAIDDLALLVAGLGLQLLDLGIDVAVDEEEVEPAVVVEVDERRRPTRASAC